MLCVDDLLFFAIIHFKAQSLRHHKDTKIKALDIKRSVFYATIKSI